MSEWKPIESAPKDGTRIKVRYKDLAPCTAYWKHGWHYIEYKHCPYPTSWQPLPESPHDP